jgi:sugar (pentulose or hexulose) kinase
MTSPTVVLVHGAFADASIWSGVIAELQAAAVNVTAPPNQNYILAAYMASGT